MAAWITFTAAVHAVAGGVDNPVRMLKEEPRNIKHTDMLVPLPPPVALLGAPQAPQFAVPRELYLKHLR